MSERGVVRFGGTLIPYTITRSRRRRKTVAITLDAHTGVVVAAPVGVPRARIEEIVSRRAAWIVHRVSAAVPAPEPKQIVSGESLPYLGRQMLLSVEHGDVPRVDVRFTDEALELSVPAVLDGEARRAAIMAELMRWYKARASKHLNRGVQRWAALGGYAPRAVLIRSQRRRWGSCGADGTLRFNWRIVLAPPTLIDYVVVHELAHLRVRNHSVAFWAEVGRLLPDYAVRRARLKEMEPSLSL